MKLFTHCAHREMLKDMESAHIEIERDMEESVTYRMLLEAAMLGTKMEELRRLLQDDPAILDRVMLECRGKDNPLHVGALYGNVDFVREILKRKPELTRELNSEGQSPLHLASARGHVEVVKEILNTKDADVCFTRDRDGMIPLHLAAIQGRVEVLEALVNAEKITAFVLTKSGEPVPHLCAKNNKFDALEKLIKLVKDDRRFVNLRDRDDNTILHLLLDKANFELIRFLLKKHNGALDVNAVNIDGCTPLDTSLKQVSGLARLKSDIALITAGAKTETPILGKGKIKMLNENYGSWFMEALLVVALLMINVAFQAALNPPGGVLQEPNNATTAPNAIWQVNGSITLPNAIFQATGNGTLPDDSLPNATHVGQSIMSFVDQDHYREFSRANNLSIIFSMLVIEILLLRCFFDHWLLDIIPIFLTSMSIVAMVSSYTVSLSFISGKCCQLSHTRTYFVSLLSTIILYVPAFVPLCRMFYFVPIWLVEKMKTQHHLWGIGSCLKTLNLKDGANSSQSETACKN